MNSVQSEDSILMTLKCDLALITVISKGNDYVPPLKGVTLDMSKYTALQI
jgi:hypothetical protein